MVNPLKSCKFIRSSALNCDSKRFRNDAAINNFTNKAEKFLVMKVITRQNVD